MKITIIINEKIAKHIEGTHTFYDCCEEAEIILLKVQKKVNAYLSQIKKEEKKC